MTINLTNFRERVEQLLADVSNEIWDRTWLDEAINQALIEYSAINPYHAITTLTISTTGHEVSISSITNLLDILRVYVPYTAASPEYPPNLRAFEHWIDPQILYFPDYEPQANEIARIFYTKLRTIAGLEGETSSTLPARDENLLIHGAAGHVATSRAIDLTEKVSVGQATAQQVRAWGLSKLQEFRAGLNAVARREALRGSSFAKLPPLDKWDRDSRDWS